MGGFLLRGGWFGAGMVTGEGGGQVVIVYGGLGEDRSRLGDAWGLEFK